MLKKVTHTGTYAELFAYEQPTIETTAQLLEVLFLITCCQIEEPHLIVSTFVKRAICDKHFSRCDRLNFEKSVLNRIIVIALLYSIYWAIQCPHRVHRTMHR